MLARIKRWLLPERGPAPPLRALLERRARKLHDAALAADGVVAPRELEELQQLERLERIYHSVQHQPPPSRWPAAIVWALTFAIVSVLLFVRVNETEIELQLTASEMGFTLREPQRLIDLTVLTSLGASGLRGMQLPATDGGSGSEAGGSVLLTAAGDGSITLGSLVPAAGTRIRLGGDGASERYRLSLEGLTTPIDVAIRGTIRTGRAGTPAATVTHAIPRALTLVPDVGTVDLDLGYAETPGPVFVAALDVSDLRLQRVTEAIEPDRTIVRTASTVLGGTLYLESLDGRARELRPAEGLRFDSSAGELRSVRLSHGQVELAFRGTVQGMTIGTETRRRSLMPTYLEWLTANHALSLFWGAVLYVSGLAFAMLRWWRNA